MALTKQFIEMQEAYETKIADLEVKLAESEKDVQKYRQHLEISNKKVIDMDKSWTKDVMELEEQIDQLKQQLAEKDQAIEGLQEINQSLGQTCNNDAKEIERLREENETLKCIIDNNKTGKFSSVTVVNALNEFYKPFLDNQLQNQRNELIEEIRKDIKLDTEYLFDGYAYFDAISIDHLETILDQLKGKGEK